MSLLVGVASFVLIGLWLASSNAATNLRYVIRDGLDGIRGGYVINHDSRIKMRDGVHLSANLYLPRTIHDPLGTVLVRLPYDKNVYWRAREAADLFAANGYAVLVQDMRGRFASEGRFAPYNKTVEDGEDTLAWIVAQPWSNGRVGTFGCSALGESQHMLAKAEDPRHVAMITMGAGGSIGSAAGRYDYFGIYEGGVLNLASAVGWFTVSGQKSPGPKVGPSQLTPAALDGLPIVGLVRQQRDDLTDYEDFVSRPLGDPWWDRLGYLTDDDGSAIPTLAINTWEDQTLAGTFAIAEMSKRSARKRGIEPIHPVIVAPGNHCDLNTKNIAYRIGNLEVSNDSQPYDGLSYDELYLAWFDYWLKQASTTPPELPNFRFFVLAENRWIESEQWPPRRSVNQQWVLGSQSGANSINGDGTLSRTVGVGTGSANRQYDEFRYDPLNPVPSKGGPVCCTGNPNDVPGHVDQSDVEKRDDVLIYTSEPFPQGYRIVGPLRTELLVSSSAVDTDFTAKLVDVSPDGSTLNIQEGALRMRYRGSFPNPVLMTPEVRYRASIDMRSIAYYLKPGHRMRLHISSSNFPRLSRNLNTGGIPAEEHTPIEATNKIWLSGESYVTVYKYTE